MPPTIHGFGSVAMSPGSSGERCLYCALPLDVVRLLEPQKRDGWLGYAEEWKQLRCPACRWWTLELNGVLCHEDGISRTYGNAFAVFEDFTIGSIGIPLRELWEYLLQRFDARHDIHPRKLEQLLDSVFRGYGFRVELTAYSKDDGIDLFLLRTPHDAPIAVQAKRNAATRKIDLAEVDWFLGTLVRHGLHHGIFVTTSSFTRGAMLAAAELRERGTLIETWDAQRLLDALRSGNAKDSADVAWDFRGAMPLEKEPVGDYGGATFSLRTPGDEAIRSWSETVSKGAAGERAG